MMRLIIYYVQLDTQDIHDKKYVQIKLFYKPQWTGLFFSKTEELGLLVPKPERLGILLPKPEELAPLLPKLEYM